MKRALLMGVAACALFAGGCVPDKKIEDAKSVSISETERRFASIVKGHQARLAEASERRNGMVTEEAMKAAFDLELFEFLRGESFRFSQWEVVIDEIKGREKAYCPVWMRNSGCIRFGVNLMAAKNYRLSFSVFDTPEIAKFLAERQAGDVIVVSGQFLPSSANSLGNDGARVPAKPADVSLGFGNGFMRGRMEFKAELHNISLQSSFAGRK